MDLDSQGRILLRISMEGEKDDLQFYFGHAFRSLKSAEVRPKFPAVSARADDPARRCRHSSGNASPGRC